MWFDIIKEIYENRNEADRLRRLGYDVPEKNPSDGTSSFSRELIIDKIKDWINNTKEISPFEEYFGVVRSRTTRNISYIEHNKFLNSIVVEETRPNTSFFYDETSERAIVDGVHTTQRKDREGFPKTFTNKYGDVVQHHHRHKMDDTDWSRFYVGVYPINSKEPIEGLHEIKSMDFNVEDIIPEKYFPTLRSGGLLNQAVKGTDSKIDKDGIVYVTGMSGNKYTIDWSSGDCNVTLRDKEVIFPNRPEWNTTVDASLCMASPDLPIGDRYMITIMGLQNDTLHTGNALKIVQFAAKDWIFPTYDKTSAPQNIPSQLSLSEEGTTRMLYEFWTPDGFAYNFTQV